MSLHIGIDLNRLRVDKETAVAWGLSYDPDSFVTARIVIPPLLSLSLAVRPGVRYYRQFTPFAGLRIAVSPLSLELSIHPSYVQSARFTPSFVV